MKKYVAEFIGTFTLVLFGCGTAVVSGQAVGHLGIAFAFGFALLAMCYGIGPVSGCHVNPAVSLGVFAAGRMSGKDLGGYIVAQLLGGIAAAGVLAVIANGLLAGYDVSAIGLGQNGWGEGYQAGYALSSAVVFEFVATLIFVIVILGVDSGGSSHSDGGFGDRHHARGDPHLRHQHHWGIRQPGSQSRTGYLGWRESNFPGLDVSACPQHRRNRLGGDLSVQGFDDLSRSQSLASRDSAAFYRAGGPKR